MRKNNKIISLIDRVSEKNKMLLLGVLFGFFTTLIAISFIPEKFILQNFFQLATNFRNIGTAGIIGIIAYSIVKVTKINKTDAGLIIIPILLISMPIISSDLTNKYSILISTLITVILAIILICAIPNDIKPNLILKWKLLDAVVILLGAFLIFISFYLPEKIDNLTIKEIVEKYDNVVFGSVFVYAVCRFFMTVLEYKIDNRN